MFVENSEKSYKIRYPILREILAEFLGTMMLMLIGCSAGASFALNPSNDPTHTKDTFAIALCWGIAAFAGIATSLEISGGHINPAVTVAMASLGKFSWRKVLPYISAQFIGSFIGTALTYICYRDAILQQNSLVNNTDQIYGNPLSTANIFATYPAPHITTFGAFVDQLIGTASLLFTVLAVTDAKSLNIPKTLQPLLLAFVVFVHCAVFGLNNGAPLNPARDLSPRLFTAFVGWGWDVFKPLHWNYWWAGGVIGPFVGGLCGSWLYYLLIEYHHPPQIFPQRNSSKNSQISSFPNARKMDDFI